ncbi:DUF4337 domain-containing protein [Vineibacter terrae]|uniref:DUF4337 domain-containing protein n=1 Tax=Vineibacter terrae TaxID=2586908 RepID=A0A5C8PVR7_9HYPH|nr:DUF4337 domain-containing protein [Vineibacter terrae]TXL82418.1 DUF4337 domain-containing protein [Vineibacter terrae]
MTGGHGHHGAGHDDHGGGSSNKKIALLISVLALFLAVSETLGKSAQTATLANNIEAANLWSFFQAKTVRMTVLRAAMEEMEIDARATTDPDIKKAMEHRLALWKRNHDRYDDEPETGEGRKQLTQRAKVAEKKRDDAAAAHHHYEVASAALQIAIVLASAAIITGITALIWGAIGLGGIAVAFAAIGLFKPHLIHLF